MSTPPSGRTDPATHKRYLEYRARHAYFGKQLPLLTLAEFCASEAEYAVLDAKGEDGRDDEESERHAELAKLLFRD
jgi:hypothetical protein